MPELEEAGKLRIKMRAIEPLDSTEFVHARFTPCNVAPPVKQMSSARGMFDLFWHFTDVRKMARRSSTLRLRKWETVADFLMHQMVLTKNNLLVVPRGRLPGWLDAVVEMFTHEVVENEHSSLYLPNDRQVWKVDQSKDELPEYPSVYRRVLKVLEQWPHKWPDHRIEIFRGGQLAKQGEQASKLLRREMRGDAHKNYEDDLWVRAIQGDKRADAKLGGRRRKQLALYRDVYISMMAGVRTVKQLRADYEGDASHLEALEFILEKVMIDNKADQEVVGG